MIVELPRTALGDFYTATHDELLEKYPIDLYFCENCSHVQLLDVVSPEVLFHEDFTYRPSNNQSVVDHFVRYATYLLERIDSAPSFCVDIGSNDGLFLSILKEKSQCTVLGIDPAKAPAEYAQAQGIETWIEFFDEAVVTRVLDRFGSADVVIANNVFAHIDNLVDVVDNIARLLRPNGFFVFEISYLLDVVKKGLLGTVFHEHLSYHSLHSLIPFLKRAGLELVTAKPVETQGGALIGLAQKSTSAIPSPAIADLLEQERLHQIDQKEGMESFRHRIHHDKRELTKILANIGAGKRVVGFGASRSANLFIEFYELGGTLDYIVDDNETKKGNFTPNGGVPIYGVSVMEERVADYVIILAWVHTKKLTQVLFDRFPSIRVISLCPEIAVVQKA